MTAATTAARKAAAFTSPIIAAIEATWAAIAARHPELPGRVAIVVSSGTAASPKFVKLGHFAEGRWSTTDGTEVHEVFIAGELLARGADAVLATMLHEAAHTLAHTRGIADTSRGGRYHNQRFSRLAVELGLDVAQVGTIGWSATTLADGTAAAYRVALAKLADALAGYRHSEGHPARKSSNNGVVWSCGCRKVRLSRKAADLGGITCQACGQDFVGDDDDTDEDDD
jgi:hypothetical protein